MNALNGHPIHLGLMEEIWLLRRLRAVKAQLTAELLAIEERIKSGHNGELTNAYRALDGDVAICDTIIRKLWVATGQPS